MGILGLSKVIAEKAPFAIKESEIKNYFGRKVAIDASMCLYQFLIAVRTNQGQLTSVDGETTSHLMGIFYRTIRLLEHGIKPVYVFDGKPPEMKAGELAKRAERREEANKALQAATEAGNEADMDKFNRRLVRATKEHAAEARELLKLMGVPFVDAPCEAEAQCAALVKSGKCFATATEDMDALTFGSKTMLRYLTSSEARKRPVKEFNYEQVLKGLELKPEEFVDLCILLGCDYCETIKGVGPKRALELIESYRNIETILENLDKKKYTIPENWNYQFARELFIKPEVLDPEQIELKWGEPNEEGLVKYLCGDKQFSEERVRAGAKKLLKSKGSQTQGRIGDFFKVMPSTQSQKLQQTPKRKADEIKKSSSVKKAKVTKKKN